MKHRKRKNHFSPDGKWETMSRPRGLLRYRPSMIFFGRTRYKGDLLFKTLETDDYDEACIRLPVYFKRWREEHDRSQNSELNDHKPTTWKEAACAYDEQLTQRAEIGDIKFASASRRQMVIRRIAFYWPSVEDLAVRNIPSAEFLRFLAEARAGKERFRGRPLPKGRRPRKGDFHGGKQSETNFNITLGVAKQIADLARKLDRKKGLPDFDNPLEDINWISEGCKLPPMPTDEEWAAILLSIGDDRCSEDSERAQRNRLLAEFKAMTGARICEIIGKTVGDHKNDKPHPGFRWKDMHKGYNSITSAKKRGDKKWKVREVPWIDGAEELMQKIREKLYKGNDNALVFEGVSKVGLRYVLKRAIKNCKLKKKLKGFTQHKIRHLFATKCVEGGCRWKALAEWLGHEDGGILAAKRYSHLRKESSQEQASKVSYRKAAAASEPGQQPASTMNGPNKVTICGREFSIQAVCRMAEKFQALQTTK